MVLPAVVILGLMGCAGAEPTNDEASPAMTRDPERSAPSTSPPGASASAVEGEPQEVAWGNVRYEVPAAWEITHDPNDDDPEPKPFPVYRQGYCEADPDRALALAVLTLDESTNDPAQAVADELRRSVEGLFEGRDPELATGELKASGEWASITGTAALAPSDDPCDNSSAMLAVKGGAANGGTAVSMLVVVAELGHPDSPAIEDLVSIANSIDTADR